MEENARGSEQIVRIVGILLLVDDRLSLRDLVRLGAGLHLIMSDNNGNVIINNLDQNNIIQNVTAVMANSVAL